MELRGCIEKRYSAQIKEREHRLSQIEIRIKMIHPAYLGHIELLKRVQRKRKGNFFIAIQK